MGSHDNSLGVSITATALVLISTVPAFRTIFTTLATSNTKRGKSSTAEKIYEDEDGAATPESQVAFSQKWAKLSITILTIAVFSINVALAVISTLESKTLDEDIKSTMVVVWTSVGIWSLIILQTTSILISRHPVESFDLGIFGTISSAISFAAQIIHGGLLSPDSNTIGSPEIGHSNIIEILRITLLPLTVLTAVSFSTIPRRPTVFKDSKPVDGVHTVSALGRYTFSWANSLVQLAGIKNKTNEQLEMEDLPTPDHLIRSRDLSNRWAAKARPGRLWWELTKEYKWPLITQWVLTLLQAFGNFAPPFVLLHILQLLERRQAGGNVGYQPWVWVFALGATTAVASWIEAWLFWISWSFIAIPMRGQLSALIFQKSMRRKDIHGASKKAESDSKDGDKDEDEIEEEPDQKSRQSTVNLIAVDTKRVSDFGSFNNYFPGSLFKLLVSLTFLLTLLGWKALGCGFLTMAVTLPINIYFSTKYAAAQGNLMTIRDVKTAVVTEALQGVRQIKFSALEDSWGGKIGAIRNKELREQKRVFQFDTMLIFCWITSPIMLAATSLAVYAWETGGLEASVAFTAIGVFKQLEVTLGVVPELTTDLLDAWISIKRIEEYLRSPEIEEKDHEDPADAISTPEHTRKEVISFDNASIAWPSDESKETRETGEGEVRYVLRDLNISFPPGELSVISGKTGTGKSLLLSAILGEIDILSGSIHVPPPPPLSSRFDHKATPDNWILPTSLAYVAQIPWIENASIKDNILFGLPYDKERYEKTVEVCALKKDLDMLTDGESTEIGANGINLSGGQRWRVTFARALYSRAGILILDDIFSAVDAHVGREIFEKGLTGVLGVGRTRVLVTHHVGLVKSKAKYLVELGDGTVAHAGMVEELEQGGVLEEIIKSEETETTIQDDVVESGAATAVNSSEGSIEEEVEEDGGALKRVESKKAVAKFVEEEAVEKGRVKSKIYREYLSATGGFPFWFFAIAVFFGQMVLQIGRSWWLRLWTGSYEESGAQQILTYFFQPSYTSGINQTAPFHIPDQTAFISHSQSSTIESLSTDATSTLTYYLGLYIALSLAASILGTFRYYYIFMGSLRASSLIFTRLTHTILRTPLRWIDTVPLGRILNRFTADVTVLDARLASDIAAGSNSIFNLIGIILAGVIVSPYVIVLALAILLWSLYIARMYILGARAVKRLESTVKSPLFEQFSSALTGISTIRAFDKTQIYISRMYAKIDAHSTAFYNLWLFNRWMGFRLSQIGALFAMIVAAFIISRPNIGASLAGFALAFALDFTSAVIWSVRHGTNMELDFNAAERIIEYSNLTTETQDGISPPAAWPTEGVMEISNLVVGYAPDLPPVLKNLSFRVLGNERVGVVGRTGAGKSSLTLALFRFLEAREGSIFIDGIDISTVRLQDLRGRLAIIPQDPVLFSGTVRSNLDPFDRHSDGELREALRRVHLIGSDDLSEGTATPTPTPIPTVEGQGQDQSQSPDSPTTSTGISPTPNKNTNPFTSLHTPISPSGLNLSQGQRQLLCLARAIISTPKIIILDEATSAVDMATDALIQRSIREEFKGSTLLVIAHRLSTVADFDKVLVMEGGRVGEFGSPRELLVGEGKGLFAGMVAESGERDVVRGIVLGEKGGK